MTTITQPTYCKVKECRFSNTHTTLGHQCGTCGEFGHGQIECGNENQKRYLRHFYTEKLPLHNWCNLCPDGSVEKQLHMECSHTCLNCEERTTSHKTNECIIQDLEVFSDRFNGIQDINTFETHLFMQHGTNIYTRLYAGMGCIIYVRHKDNIVKALFMHSDDWGQYGPANDNTPKLNKFITGCQEHDKLLFQTIITSTTSVTSE